MKISSPFLLRLGGALYARVSQAVLATLDFKAVSCDPTTDPLHPLCDRRYLYVTWHESVLVGLPLRAHSGMMGIASAHRDGELLNQAAAQLGWNMVRGSTSRGAVSALKQLMRESSQHLNIAPDGPRGPRREMAQGAIYLAAKSQLPLICCAYGYDRPWRLKSWDRCVIPRPFSRARAIFGPPITIPRKVSREDLERYRSGIERLMNRLTLEAESWAASGEQRAFEFRLRPRRVPSAVASNPAIFQQPLSSEATELLDQLPAAKTETVAQRTGATSYSEWDQRKSAA